MYVRAFHAYGLCSAGMRRTYCVVQKPMDILTIEKNLEERKYTTNKEVSIGCVCPCLAWYTLHSVHGIDIHVRCDARHAIVTRDGGQKVDVYNTYICT